MTNGPSHRSQRSAKRPRIPRLLGAVLTAVVLYACRDDPTAVGSEGMLSLAFTAAEGVAAVDQVRVTLSPRDGGTPVQLTLQDQGGGRFEGSRQNLPIGTYDVTVRGLSSGEVEAFGQSSAVVRAGEEATAQLTLTAFVPTVNPIADVVGSNDFTVTWSTVTGADRYVAQASPDPGFATGVFDAAGINGTTGNFSAPNPGRYHVRVRAERDDVSELGKAGVDSVLLFTGTTAFNTVESGTLAAGAVDAYQLDVSPGAALILIGVSAGGQTLDPTITIGPIGGRTLGGDFNLGPFNNSLIEMTVAVEPSASTAEIPTGRVAAAAPPPEGPSAPAEIKTIVIGGAGGTAGDYQLTTLSCAWINFNGIGFTFDESVLATDCESVNLFSAEIAHGVLVPFDGVTDDEVELRVVSADFNPTTLLFGPGGNLLAADNDGLQLGGSEISLTLPEDGRYYAWVSPFDNGDTGAFRMAVRRGFGGPDHSLTEIVADDAALPPDGASQTTVTVFAKDANGDDYTIGGDAVTLSTDLGTIDAVPSDNGDGTYTATLTAAATSGTGSITGTINGNAIGVTTTVVFADPGTPDAAQSTISSDRDVLLGDGVSTATITVQIKDAAGLDVSTGGWSVVLSTTFGTISATTDNGDGTYTAILTAPAAGVAEVTGTLDGTAIGDAVTVFPIGVVATQEIVFASDRDGDLDLWVMDADGGNLVKLLDMTDDVTGPGWSPDGMRIVFAFDGSVRALQLDGSAMNQLAVGDVVRSPRYSPDDTQVAFVRSTFQPVGPPISELTVMSDDGTNQNAITGIRVSTISWSPDGTQLVFDETNGLLFTIDADGSNRQQITPVNYRGPAWAPNGNRLAASSGPNALDITTMDPDGSNRDTLLLDAPNDFTPEWSPGSDRLVFVSNRDGNDEIYVMNVDGSGLTRLTNHGGVDQHPHWKPGPSGTPAVASVVMLSDGAQTTDGSTTNLNAEARDAGGAPIPGKTFVWTTTNPNIAVVDASGTVTGVHPGQTTVFAEVDGFRDHAVVTVTAASASSPVSWVTGNGQATTANSTSLDLLGVWSPGNDEAFIVGGDATFPPVGDFVLEYDGAFWTSSTLPGPNVVYRSLHGTGPNDVFAVGIAGAIAHFNGAGWSQQSSGVSFGMEGVWAAAPDDVFAVGRAGTVLRYDGAVWTAMSVPTDQFISAIWGSSSTDIYAVGFEGFPGDAGPGFILHYDGVQWSFALNDGVTPKLHGVWGTGPNDVYAVGESGTVLQWNGSTWNGMSSSTSGDLFAVWGTSSSDIFAVGDAGTAVRFDGANWSPHLLGVLGLTVRGIWGTTDGVFVAAEGGSIAFGSR